MELGEKLRMARQEAGLSQRQLCGEVITRNMLSQIEHGTARPSMETLRFLAARLEKPVSYFLEEDVVTSPNQTLMEQARQAYASGDVPGACQYLEAFRQPDPVLEWEWRYLSSMAMQAAAAQALTQGKTLYARQLLEKAAAVDCGIPGVQRQRLLLLGRIPGVELAEIVGQLPSLDEELLLRAEAALLMQAADRAQAMLAAAEDQESSRWNLLMGQSLLQKKQYAAASQCLKKAEEDYPEVCIAALEVCYRELGDYRQAYEYACKQR